MDEETTHQKKRQKNLPSNLSIFDCSSFCSRRNIANINVMDWLKRLIILLLNMIVLFFLLRLCIFPFSHSRQRIWEDPSSWLHASKAFYVIYFILSVFLAYLYLVKGRSSSRPNTGCSHQFPTNEITNKYESNYSVHQNTDMQLQNRKTIKNQGKHVIFPKDSKAERVKHLSPDISREYYLSALNELRKHQRCRGKGLTKTAIERLVKFEYIRDTFNDIVQSDDLLMNQNIGEKVAIVSNGKEKEDEEMGGKEKYYSIIEKYRKSEESSKKDTHNNNKNNNNNHDNNHDNKDKDGETNHRIIGKTNDFETDENSIFFNDCNLTLSSPEKTLHIITIADNEPMRNSFSISRNEDYIDRIWDDNQIDQVMRNEFPISSIQSSVNSDSIVSHISENEHHCVICLEMYQEEEILVQLPCGHIHHDRCISLWLEEKSNCPLCNINLNMEAITFWYEISQSK